MYYGAKKKSLQALNRTLKDLRGTEQLFGDALILLSIDFRQTLAVIPRSTSADDLNACLKSSVLWRSEIDFENQCACTSTS
jgi:hypothetical protein